MNLLQKIAYNPKIIKPAIYGISSFELSDEEKFFFSKNPPIGFILFSRNIKNPQQLLNLTKKLQELTQGECLILIDQEGGRVARMKQPFWQEFPAAGYFVELYLQDKNFALEKIYANFKEISIMLKQVGINVNCVPLLDILTEETHEIIGNRALGSSPQVVIDLAQKVCQALDEEQVYPVIKHIPGHGRAKSDSHLELPVVNASLQELQKHDFLPFIALKNQKLAMTAHIKYVAIDENFCATLSKKVINLIRSQIGFNNILMTDDLSMQALEGSFNLRAEMAINAGCDLILHCNGNLVEMQQIDSAISFISDNLRCKFFE